MTDYSLNTQKQIDLLASDFEQAWGTEAALSIETILDGNRKVNRKLLLSELLLLEFELRQDETLTIGRFLERFPSDQTAVKAAWQTFQEEHKSDQAKQSTPRIELDATILSAAEEPGADELQATVSDGRAPRQHVAPDLKMGRYLILEEIGHGGMGVVYRAHDPEMKRDVALKVIQAGALAKESDKRRFRREAEAVSQLSHPNIVPVFDCQLSDQQAYFAMQFIQGQTIQDATENGLFKPEDAADILIKVAEAIQHAHEQKIIHRDLKPQNILLEGKDRHPWVVDFGLAANLADAELTQTGELVGTPKYMAPEQISSKFQKAFGSTEPQEADGEFVGENTSLAVQTDIYGLGGLLYFMLSGRAPHNGTSFTEVLQAVTSEEPDSLFDNSKIPRDLATICHKCLEKEPRDRYESAADLSADLKRYKNHEPIQAKPTPLLKRAAKWVRRNPWPTRFLATLSVFAVVAAGSAVAFQGIAQSESEAKTEAIAAQNAAIKAREQAEATQKQLEETVGQLRDENVGRTIAEAQGALAIGDYQRFRDVTKQFDTINGDRNPAQARLMKSALREQSQPRMVETKRVVDGNWEISSAALSPDGKRLVALDGGSLISVFDIERFRVLRRLTRGFFIDKEEVKDDGQIVPFGHFYDHAVMAADPDLKPLESTVYTSVCWAGDPLRVVATQADGRVILLDPEKSVEAKTVVDRVVWKGDSHLTTSASASVGKSVLVGDESGTVTLLSLTQDMPEKQFEAESEITCIVSHVDGWLVGTQDGEVLSFGSDLQLKHKMALGFCIWSIAVDGDRIAVAGNHAAIKILKLEDQLKLSRELKFEPLVELGRRIKAFVSVQFAEDKVWGFDDIGRVYVWNRESQGERVGEVAKYIRNRSIMPPRSPRFRRVVFSQNIDGKMLTADQAGNISLLEVKRPERQPIFSKLPIQLGPNPRIEASSIGQPSIWCIDDTGVLRAIDADGSEMARVQAFTPIERAHAERATAEDLYPGGTDITSLADGRVFTVGLSSEIKVWQMKSQRIEQVDLRLFSEAPLMSVAVSEARSLAAGVDVRSRLNVWDLKSGRRTHVIPMLDVDVPESHPLTGKLAFNNDGSMLAAFGSGQSGFVYSTASWKPLGYSMEVAGFGGVDIAWSDTNSRTVVRTDSRHTRNYHFLGDDQIQAGSTSDSSEFLHGDPSLLLSVETKGRLTMRSQRTGSALCKFDVGFSGICDITADPETGVFLATKDGRLLAESSDAQPVHGDQVIASRSTISANVHDVIPLSAGYAFARQGQLRRDRSGQLMAIFSCGKGNPNRNGQIVIASRGKRNLWALETAFADADRPVFSNNVDLQTDPLRIAFRAVTDPEIYQGDCLLLTKSDDGRWLEETVHGKANTGFHPAIITSPLSGNQAVLHYDHMYRDVVLSEQSDASENGWPMRRMAIKSGIGFSVTQFNKQLWICGRRQRYPQEHNAQCFTFGSAGFVEIPVPSDVAHMQKFEFSSTGVPAILCQSRVDQSVSVRAWNNGEWDTMAEIPRVTTMPERIVHLAFGRNDEIVVPVTHFKTLLLLIYREGQWQILSPACEIHHSGIYVLDMSINENNQATLLVGATERGRAWVKSVDIQLPD